MIVNYFLRYIYRKFKNKSIEEMKNKFMCMQFKTSPRVQIERTHRHSVFILSICHSMSSVTGRQVHDSKKEKI